MLLDMAVKERKSWLVGGEVHDGSAIVWNNNGILNHAGGLLAVDLDQLPQVTVKVHRVCVVGTISHYKPIADTLLQHKLSIMWIRLAVHEP